MTRFAIVDLEATDAKKSGDKIKIIQVGIVLMEEGIRVGQFATDVNPHEKLSKKIRELTGLTNKRLAEAPDFSKIAAQIMLTLEGSTFVAHNVKFDYGLLSSELAACGYKLDMPCVDTVELARVMFPTFERYGLDALDEHLGLRNEHPHAALSDSLATAELLKRIQERARKLPRAVLQEILRHADNLLFDSRVVLEDCLKDCAENVHGLVLRGSIATRKRRPLKVQRKNPESFEKALGELGLSFREKQAELAETLRKDLDNGLPSFFEAQAGIGKTYGYLLPLLVAGERVIISMPTKVLQEQFMTDLAPELWETFGVQTTKMTGKTNYISLERLRLLLLETDSGKNFEIFKMKCLIWLTETLTGELSELSTIMTSRDMLSAVAHDGQVADGQLHSEQDFWLALQNQAQRSDIIIVNHAYLIERLSDQAETFLRDRVLVLDEAQQLFSVLEHARQKEIKVIDLILSIPNHEIRTEKRLIESLLFHLGKRTLDIDKILQNAKELGLSELTEFLSDPERIYWMDGNCLKSSPQDFYNFAKLITPGTKTIFIGAGLSFSEDNPMLPEFLGYDMYNFYKLEQKLAVNQEMCIVTDGPSVQNLKNQDYATYVSENLSDLLTLGLPIIVLFTSQLLLDWTAQELKKNEISVLVQDAHHRPEQLKKDFDEGKAQILLATGMFWEGVDFDKQDKLILVLPRLPFATPDDILTKKFASQFDNAFYDFNVPMATLKIRQAIGRVNRRPSQQSVVLVLDGRLAGKSYAKRMRRNLHEVISIQKLSADAASAESQKFLQD